ncbi:MAG: carbohydrate binding family 9 domain-containing protein [Proteobacteria bacterium]|nr:carbohydrate binding family 9 domain-containing protein [Pseudomonadota bacterium]
MPVTPIRFVMGVLLAFLCSAAAQAESVSLPHTGGSVVIDGVLDDEAWGDATQIELDFETRPGENIPARVRTVAFLMEDGENLYIGFAASDPDPSAIRAYLRDRDSAYDDDFVGIVIDTYNDGRRAFEFFANPLGVQMDMTNNEVSSRGSFNKEDDSWDAIWDSAGRINDEGYAVEMKIPLNQLRFPASDGLQTWGFDLTRTYPRSKRYRFSNNPTDRGINCYLCQIGELSGLKDAEPGRDLEIVPTLTASQSSTTDEPGDIPMVSGDAKADAGVSIRWGISPDLTANLAINPDFSQVEADVAQLDVNTRFALFFPEKRPFFLEGADYFETPIQAVFTRTIASPTVGAKLTGKRGDHTFGIFAAEDEITNLLFPGPFESETETLEQSNTAFVGRYSRGFGDTSSIGGLVTVRDGDGYHNYVGGIDGRWKINDQHTLSMQYLKSETEYPVDVATEFEQPQGAFDGTGAVARYEFDSRNWFANLRFIALSDGFRADSGFESQVGGDEMKVDLGRVWHGVDGGWWTRIRLHNQYVILHLEDGTLVTREASLRLGVGGPMQSWTQIMLSAGSELADGVLFNKKRIGLYFEAQPRGGLSLQIYTHLADRIDYANTQLAEQWLLQPSVNWNINRNLLMRLAGTYFSMDTKQGEKIFDASVIDARLTWQFDRRSFVRLTVQSTDIDRNLAAYNVPDDFDARSRDVGRQLLYSYKLNPQTVFFLGYSDQYVDDDSLDGLTATDRNWFMKIGYAWTL